jgi:hypothetical protein
MLINKELYPSGQTLDTNIRRMFLQTGGDDYKDRGSKDTPRAGETFSSESFMKWIGLLEQPLYETELYGIFWKLTMRAELAKDRSQQQSFVFWKLAVPGQ